MTKIAQQTDATRALGRRKSASARVRIDRGTGKVTVNGKPLNEYFKHFIDQENVISALKAVGKEKDLDVSVKVQGGGMKGQVVAVRHGIARALVVWNEDFKTALKTIGFLTRDPRVKERKKPGLKKARKGPTWSKR